MMPVSAYEEYAVTLKSGDTMEPRELIARLLKTHAAKGGASA